jgi:hypothetical protein
MQGLVPWLLETKAIVTHLAGKQYDKPVGKPAIT